MSIGHQDFEGKKWQSHSFTHEEFFAVTCLTSFTQEVFFAVRCLTSFTQEVFFAVRCLTSFTQEVVFAVRCLNSFTQEVVFAVRYLTSFTLELWFFCSVVSHSVWPLNPHGNPCEAKQLEVHGQEDTRCSQASRPCVS